MTSFRHYVQFLRNFRMLSNAQKLNFFQKIYLVQMNKPQLFVNFYIYIKKFFKGRPPFFYQDSIVLVVKTFPKEVV